MPASNDRFYIAGGTLSSEASSYVVRQADTSLRNGLLEGEFCYVLSTRQIGKSSLMVRAAQRLREQGVLVGLLDLTAIGQNVTPEQWYDGLLTLLAEQWRMQDILADFWLDHERLGPMQRWMEALRHIVLENRPEPVCLFVDEIDAVRSLPFSTNEFFAGIRECYNRRSQDSAFQRLTFCLLGVATPADLISDPRVSPFNIGRRITLTDFTLEEAASLAAALPPQSPLPHPPAPSPEQVRAEGGANRMLPPSGRGKRSGIAPSLSPAGRGRGLGVGEGALLLERVLYWTGGHPYLTQCLCRKLAQSSLTLTAREVDAACEELFLGKQAQETDDNLAFVRNRLLHGDADRTALLDLYQRIRSGSRCKEDATNPLHNTLLLSGIVKVVSGALVVRNRIYHQVFDARWVLENMSDAEVRRQKAAYRRGVVRSASVFGSLAVVVGTLLVIAIVNVRYARSAELRANVQADRASRLLYIADLNLIQREWDGGNIVHVLELLEETRDSKYRGFEWNYWNRRCHRSLRTFFPQDAVAQVALSPEGGFLATLNRKGRLIVWNVESGSELFSLQTGEATEYALLYSPDARRLLVGVGKEIQVREAATGRLLQTISAGAQSVYNMACSADGAYLLTCSKEGTIHIHDARSGRHLSDLPNRSTSLLSIAASDTEAATCDAEGTIRLRNLRRLGAIRTLNTKFEGGVFALSHTGAYLVGRGVEGGVKVLDTKTDKVLYTLNMDSDLRALHFSSDDSLLVVFTARGAHILDIRTGRERDAYQEHRLEIRDGALSRDGRYIATGSLDGTAKLWDVRQGYEPRTLRASGQPFWLIRYSPDSRQVAVGSTDGCAYLWDALTGRLLRTLKGHTQRVNLAAFSHDGRRLVTGCMDGSARLWDARTGESQRAFACHQASVNGAVFTQDDREILTGSDDLTAKVWNVETGAVRLTLRGHNQPVESVALSPDGRRIATGSDDTTVKLWDANTGKLLRTFHAPAEVWSVVFSPDGTRLATANLNNTAQVWDVDTGRLICTLNGHTHWVVAIAFSPDGKRLVTGSRDTTAKVWEAQTGRELLTLRGHRRQVIGVAFSPDGNQIATSGGDGEARLWQAVEPIP